MSILLLIYMNSAVLEDRVCLDACRACESQCSSQPCRKQCYTQQLTCCRTFNKRAPYMMCGVCE
jgi:hypothetical protein